VHEMTIAVGLIELAEEQAKAAGATRINTLDVEIGALAGVEIEALSFCYEAARRGTMCDVAELNIIALEGRGRCSECGEERAADFHVAFCPDCGRGLEILQGRELRLRSLNVD